MREILSKENLYTPRSVKFLYNNFIGNVCLYILTRRWVSKLMGKYMNSRLSKRKINKYIKKNNIDMSLYIDKDYKSFNDFFTRQIKEEKRPFALEKEFFVSPCDGKVSAYKIDYNSKFLIKGFNYTVDELLKDKNLAEKYIDGICLVIRIAVEDYHRYFYIDDGTKEKTIFIQGRLHTVQPYALSKRKVFTENCREYTLMHTKNFGDITQIEVGAMMVGRIANNDMDEVDFKKGTEKGKFEFGGSTIVLLIEKDKVVLDEEFFINTNNDNETYVLCGEKIGVTNK